jgi:YidC/Oxa1 family membrane protein insertase
MFSLILLEGETGFFSSIYNTVLAPFQWLVSGLLVLFHKLFAPVTGFDSGLTWILVVVAITIVVRSAMIPLYVKSLISMRGTTAIQPKLKEIQEKYKGDRDRINRETMKLYDESGVNPYSSCLPMLIQMPIFFGMFGVLNGLARGQSVGRWLTDRPELAEALKNAELFGVRVTDSFGGFPPPQWGLTQGVAIVLIIIMTVAMVGQQWYTMNYNMAPASLEGPMGKSQKMMLWVFPLMFVFSGFTFPIMLLVYWTFSNVWTVGQQLIMIRLYPTPNTPAYADWEDRMIAKGLDPKEIEAERLAKARAKKNPNSLLAKAAQAAGANEAKATEVEEVAPVVSSGQSKPRTEQVTQTVRVDPNTGKKVVVRSQAKNQPRSKRKK